MSDTLRLIAVICQLAGLTALVLLRTYDVDRSWQGLVLMLMLLSALIIWLIRRYRHNQVRRDSNAKAKPGNQSGPSIKGNR